MLSAHWKIIEFELRRHGPPGHTCTPITGYFYDEPKIYKENLREDYYLQEAIHHTLTWAKSLTKFNIKMQDIECVLDLNRKYKED